MMPMRKTMRQNTRKKAMEKHMQQTQTCRKAGLMCSNRQETGKEQL